MVTILIGMVVIIVTSHIAAAGMRQIDESLGSIVRLGGWIIGGVVLLTGYGLVLSVALNRRLLPFPLSCISRANAYLFPPVRLLGRLLAISRLKIEQSFLHMHNRIVLIYGNAASREDLLILLPHCLETGVRRKLDQEIGTRSCTVRVVGGGSQARAAVAEVNPRAILAVACERDLVSGVVELCGKIPRILAVPNIQSRGPCKATDIHLEEFQKALEYFFPE